MVKDFGSDGFTVDESLMTNADTPLLAMQGLIDDPVNPATGNPVTADAKSRPLHLLYSEAFDIAKNNGTKFLPGYWFSVTADVRDRVNWEYLGEY